MTSNIAGLVESARGGDRASFDELVRLTYMETYTLALRLTNNVDDAADVVQDSYLRAYKSLGNFRGEAQFTTWLYRITANCASTHLAKRQRHRHDELDDDNTTTAVELDVDPESSASAALDRRDLSVALGSLPMTLRSVIVLRDIYDLPHEAIAAELGISETTAKVRLHRARKRLRDLLLADTGEESDVRAV